MYVFENMMYPLVVLGLVDVVDVDEHDFEASDISKTILCFFLDKGIPIPQGTLTDPPQPF